MRPESDCLSSIPRKKANNRHNQTCRADLKPIISPISLGLPHFICINDVNSDSLAYGKKVPVLTSQILLSYSMYLYFTLDAIAVFGHIHKVKVKSILFFLLCFKIRFIPFQLGADQNRGKRLKITKFTALTLHKSYSTMLYSPFIST